MTFTILIPVVLIVDNVSYLVRSMIADRAALTHPMLG
jgi:hypothetical protein